MKLISKLKATARRLLDMPFSPSVLIAMVQLMRAFGLLRKRADHHSQGTPPLVFVSFPFSSMGDVIVMLPLLDEIKRNLPDNRIHVAVGTNLVKLLENLPEIERVFGFPAVPHVGYFLWRIREFSSTLAQFRREVDSFDYDLALAPRWGSDSYSHLSRFLMYLTGAPQRCSYSATVDGGQRSIDKYSTNLATGGYGESESIRQRRLLVRAGVLSEVQSTLPISSHHGPLQRIADHLTPDFGRYGSETLLQILEGPYVVVSPGATKATHRWPGERYREVIASVQVKYGLPSLIIGGKSDVSLCAQIANGIPEFCISLAGLTEVEELIALVRRASLFIGNDSGPGHIAANLGVSCISINPFPKCGEHTHPDSSLRWSPSGPRVAVLQPDFPRAPCSNNCEMGYPHCILQVSVEQVLTTVGKMVRYHEESSAIRSRGYETTK